MNLTPASSSDLPSEAILTRVSESGTRLMHTAIFMGAENKPGNWLLATACGLATPDPCIGGVFSRLSFSESDAACHPERRRREGSASRSQYSSSPAHAAAAPAGATVAPGWPAPSE